MTMRKGKGWNQLVVFALLGCLAVVVGGCAGLMAKGPSPEVVQCPAKISWDLADSVALTQFVCSVEEIKGKPTLQYTVELQNVSDRPLRYRVMVLNPEGKSVGGLLPVKGKPPVVQPGAKEKFSYPVSGYTEIPAELEVIVRALED